MSIDKTSQTKARGVRTSEAAPVKEHPKITKGREFLKALRQEEIAQLYDNITQPTEDQNGTTLITSPKAYEDYLRNTFTRRYDKKVQDWVTNKNTMTEKQVEAWRTDPLWHMSKFSPDLNKILANALFIDPRTGHKHYFMSKIAQGMYGEFFTGGPGMSMKGDFTRMLTALRSPVTRERVVGEAAD